MVILIAIYLFVILHRFKWLSILGTKYKAGCTLEIGTDEYDNPIFGQVLKICAVNKNINDILFVVSKLDTGDFSGYYQSFEVKSTLPRRKIICHHRDLKSFLPLNQVKPFGVATRKKYVVQRFEIGTTE